MRTQTIHPRRIVIIAAYAGVILACVMILGKTWAYYTTGSASILSSLIDSVIDSLISLIALASITYANRPADEDHRWGHGKMEAVSALFQSAILIAGGGFVVFEALNRFISPVPVTHHSLGVGVMAFSIVLSVLLVMIQRFALTRAESLALEADKLHYSSDILINIGVIIILILGYYGAPHWLDPLFALCVAFFLGRISFTIGGRALNMLMDRELPDTDRQKVINILKNHADISGWHDLRMHHHGLTTIISVDIEIDGTLSLSAAHDIAKKIESDILKNFPESEILIHMDPTGYTEDSRHKIKGVHH